MFCAYCATFREFREFSEKTGVKFIVTDDIIRTIQIRWCFFLLILFAMFLKIKLTRDLDKTMRARSISNYPGNDDQLKFFGTSSNEVIKMLQI